MKTMNASDFKAQCLAILDQVRLTGESLVILKRGQPVAVLGPVVDKDAKSPQSDLQGTAEVVGDILNPVLPEEHWESLNQ